MQTKVGNPGNQQYTRETDEELADVLTAISVVAKRLARKLNALASQKDAEQESYSADIVTITEKGA